MPNKVSMKVFPSRGGDYHWANHARVFTFFTSFHSQDSFWQNAILIMNHRIAHLSPTNAMLSFRDRLKDETS